MDPKAVRHELAARLGAISQLRAHAFPPGTITPDAAIIAPQKIKYHLAYGDEANSMELVLVVVSGEPHDRSSHSRLDEYAADAGDRSIRAVLESGTYTAFDEITVTEAEWDAVTIAGTDYLACVFTLSIYGPGG
jgi:hypothetical protein